MSGLFSKGPEFIYRKKFISKREFVLSKLVFFECLLLTLYEQGQSTKVTIFSIELSFLNCFTKGNKF